MPELAIFDLEFRENTHPIYRIKGENSLTLQGQKHDFEILEKVLSDTQKEIKDTSTIFELIKEDQQTQESFWDSAGW